MQRGCFTTSASQPRALHQESPSGSPGSVRVGITSEVGWSLADQLQPDEISSPSPPGHRRHRGEAVAACLDPCVRSNSPDRPRRHQYRGRQGQRCDRNQTRATIHGRPHCRCRIKMFSPCCFNVSVSTSRKPSSCGATSTTARSPDDLPGQFSNMKSSMTCTFRIEPRAQASMVATASLMTAGMAGERRSAPSRAQAAP